MHTLVIGPSDIWIVTIELLYEFRKVFFDFRFKIDSNKSSHVNLFDKFVFSFIVEDDVEAYQGLSGRIGTL